MSNRCDRHSKRRLPAVNT